MIDGLEKQSKRDGFEIDMESFAYYADDMCFGCAATCTVQKIAGTNLPADNAGAVDFQFEAVELGFDNLTELRDFENAIDDARRGILKSLYKFYEKKDVGIDIEDDDYELISMETHNWEEQIPFVEDTIIKLQEIGY